MEFCQWKWILPSHTALWSIYSLEQNCHIFRRSDPLVLQLQNTSFAFCCTLNERLKSSDFTYFDCNKLMIYIFWLVALLEIFAYRILVFHGLMNSSRSEHPILLQCIDKNTEIIVGIQLNIFKESLKHSAYKYVYVAYIFWSYMLATFDIILGSHCSIILHVSTLSITMHHWVVVK